MGVNPLPGIRGTVVWRGEEGYEPTRQAMLWNEWKPRRFPEVIVTAASAEDVVQAVRLARAQGLTIAVRSGGHSWCGSPLRDGGMLIDLSRLRELTVDPASRTASVSPAFSNRELFPALAEHGLAFPLGHCPTVCMGGYLLAGGLGWNLGAWGPACLSVREIEVVTAEGELVRASEHENAELFWAARGAGPGFFGVVTRFVLDLRPLPRAITTSTYVHPLARLDEVAGWADELGRTLAPEVELTVFLATAPPGVPAEPAGRAVYLTATAFADTAEEAAAALAPLDGLPHGDGVLLRQVRTPTPFDTLFEGADAFWPEGHRGAGDTAWTNAGFAGILPRLSEQLVSAPSAQSLILIAYLPAPPGGTPMPDTAFSLLGQICVTGYAIWQDQAEDEANVGWLREAMTALEPFTIGHRVAEADLPADPARSIRSFSEPDWERLRELRRRFDPHGVFHTYLGLPESM